MAALKHKPQHFFRIFSLLWHISQYAFLPSDSNRRTKSRIYYNALGIATKLGELKPNAKAVCKLIF